MMLRVLVVDDDESMRRLLAVALPLAAPGIEVVPGAKDVEEGLQAARRDHPDVIILDHMMPRRTGADALGEFKEACPDGEVVLFSAYLDAPQTEQVLEDAVVEHGVRAIPKGSLDEIEQVVRSAALKRFIA